jgi:hypothetical protein
MKKSQSMIRVQFHITEAHLEKLRVESEGVGLSMSDIARRAFDLYFERREKKERRAR